MMLDGSFNDFLNQRKPEDAQILIALRYYVAEVTEDKLPDEMLEDMSEQAGDADALAAVREAFAKNRSSQVAAALLLFENAWKRDGERERIRHAFDAVSKKLPVVEAALIAIVAMYALFMVGTDGVKKETVTERRGPDGTFETVHVRENFSPMDPLMAVVSLVTGGVKKFRASKGKG